MNSDYWYYTLSAVPQTLAALVALVATFLAVKLDKFDKGIAEIRDSIKRFVMLIDGKIEIHDLLKKSDKEILELLESCVKKLDIDDKFLGVGEVVYKKLLREMQYQIGQYRGLFRADRERIHSFLEAQENRLAAFIDKKRSGKKYMLITLVPNCSVIVFSLLFCLLEDWVTLTILFA